MPASTTIPSVPVANKDNLVVAVNALRQALIALSNTPAAQDPTASVFKVTNQVIIPVTYNGVTIQQLVALSLTNPVTGEIWTWQAPTSLTQGNTLGGVSSGGIGPTGPIGPTGSIGLSGNKFTGGVQTTPVLGGYVDIPVTASYGYAGITGIMIQSGQVNGDTSTYQVTYPTPFPNACIALLGIDSDANNRYFYGSAAGPTSGDLYASGSANGNVSWIAFGY